MYLDATEDSGRQFYLSDVPGGIVMLNLLRFKATADYTDYPELAPSEPISGRQAYRTYMQLALPFIQQAGSELIFHGRTLPYLIGPMTEEWDEMLLVTHKGKEEFLKFAQHEGYLKIKGHRQAALQDSRLLPLISKS